MEPAVHREFKGLAGLMVFKRRGTAETLRQRRDRKGTQAHAGPAELRESAGSTTKEYVGRSTRTGRRRTLLT